MGDAWYVRRGKSIEGPFTRTELRQAALAGTVSPDTLVSENQLGNWVTAKRIGNVQFGKVIEPSTTTLRRPAKSNRLRSAHRRKIWVLLGIAAIAVCTAAFAISRFDKQIPVAEHTMTTTLEGGPRRSAEYAASDQEAIRPTLQQKITQRWRRKWLRAH